MLDVPYMKKILILAANPRKDLNLDREIRDLKRVIQSSAHGDSFQVINEPAVRVSDLQDLLFKHRPQIVHFCGHGGGEAGLVFESDLGREQQVKTEALSELFRLFDDGVECVLLNACYSQDQAEAIVQHIRHVIGMNQEIRDDAAIAFSKGFYRALGYDCSIKEAFEFGKNAIQLEISGSSVVRSGASPETRKLNIANAVTTAIPEHLKPILKTNPQVAPTRPNTISQDKRTEIQLELEQFLAEAKATLAQGALAQGQSKPANSKRGWIWGGAAIGILALGGIGSQLLWPKSAPSDRQQIEEITPAGNGESAQSYIQKAKTYIQAGDNTAAEIELEKALASNSQLATPHCLLATLHDAATNEQDLALDEWELCLQKADPNDPEQKTLAATAKTRINALKK
jgi:tetratricopeptide (TPR) repeat protein